MNRPIAHLHAVPAPADPLAEAQAVVDRIKAERTELFIDRLGEVIELAREIAAPDAGYKPGIREGARRLLDRLTEAERLSLSAISQRGGR